MVDRLVDKKPKKEAVNFFTPDDFPIKSPRGVNFRTITFSANDYPYDKNNSYGLPAAYSRDSSGHGGSHQTVNTPKDVADDDERWEKIKELSGWVTDDALKGGNIAPNPGLKQKTDFDEALETPYGPASSDKGTRVSSIPGVGDGWANRPRGGKWDHQIDLDKAMKALEEFIADQGANWTKVPLYTADDEGAEPLKINIFSPGPGNRDNYSRFSTKESKNITKIKKAIKNSIYEDKNREKYMMQLTNEELAELIVQALKDLSKEGERGRDGYAVDPENPTQPRGYAAGGPSDYSVKSQEPFDYKVQGNANCGPYTAESFQGSMLQNILIERAAETSKLSKNSSKMKDKTFAPFTKKASKKVKSTKHWYDKK